MTERDPWWLRAWDWCLAVWDAVRGIPCPTCEDLKKQLEETQRAYREMRAQASGRKSEAITDPDLAVACDSLLTGQESALDLPPLAKATLAEAVEATWPSRSMTACSSCGVLFDPEMLTPLPTGPLCNGCLCQAAGDQMPSLDCAVIPTDLGGRSIPVLSAARRGTNHPAHRQPPERWPQRRSAAQQIAEKAKGEVR